MPQAEAKLPATREEGLLSGGMNMELTPSGGLPGSILLTFRKCANPELKAFNITLMWSV